MTFDRFAGQYSVTGRLRALTALRVGAVRAPAGVGTDRAVVRDALDRPYLPGSSLKGALRIEVERLVRAARPARACDPAGDADGRCVTVAAWTQMRAGTSGERGADSADAIGAATRALLEASCWVCRLFGSPWLASRVQVGDALLAELQGAVRLEVRDGAPVDRDTRTTRAGLHHDYEVVPAGAEFDWSLRVETDDPRLLGMLTLGLRELEAGRLAVGGGRGRGLGRLRLQVEQRTLVRHDADSLLAYLTDPGAATAVGEHELQAWVAAFVDCLRADALPVESD